MPSTTINNKQQDDFLSGLRRCVQTAPPGQLQAIVRSLHILISKTGEESGKKNNKKKDTSQQTKMTPQVKTALFFKYINKIVFEHICSNLYLSAEIPFGSDNGGFTALSADASIVKIGKTLNPLFAVPDFLKESLDDDIVGNEEGGIHVVLDWTRRRLHVVDPIMLEVLRSCSFKEILPAFQQKIEELKSSEEEQQQQHSNVFTPFFETLVENQKSLNEEKSFRNLLALHDVLSRSWQTNASSRFVDAAVSRTGTNIILTSSENAEEEQESSSSPFGISFTLHSQRINSDAFWSARWKSRWTLEKKKNNNTDNDAIWTLSGSVSVEYHSGEEGNVQMTGSDSVSLPLAHATAASNGASVSHMIDEWVNSTNDHAEVGATLFAPFQPPLAATSANKNISHLVDIARAIVKTMEKGEDSVQQKIETGCGPLRSEAAVKALRRKMPLNNRLIDFSNGGAGGQQGQQQQQRMMTVNQGDGESQFQ